MPGWNLMQRIQKEELETVSSAHLGRKEKTIFNLGWLFNESYFHLK